MVEVYGCVLGERYCVQYCCTGKQHQWVTEGGHEGVGWVRWLVLQDLEQREANAKKRMGDQETDRRKEV